MADGHRKSRLKCYVFLFLYICFSGLNIRPHEKNTAKDFEISKLQTFNWGDSLNRAVLSLWMIRDHVGFVSRLGKGFSRAGLSRYPYSDSTFQLTRLFIGRDVTLKAWTAHWEKELLYVHKDHHSQSSVILENISKTWACPLCSQQPKQPGTLKVPPQMSSRLSRNQ